ncbi:MAG: hypothetical protein WAU59_14850 [Rhodoplanes sp.]
MWHIVLALGAATVIAGCSSVISSLPTAVGGLPEGTPERSADPPAFPRVHEMPPQRSEGVLSGAERKKVESDLAAARDNAARRATEASAAASGASATAATGANAATTEANAAAR